MKKALRIAILLVAALAAANSFVFVSSCPAQGDGAPAPSRDAAYHYSLGTMLTLDGKFKEAAKEYEAALALDPKSSFLAAELASLYVKMGELDRALTVCEQSLIYNPDQAETYALMGSIYLFKKDYEKAIGAYKRVIALDPKSHDTYLYLSVIYAELKRYDEAVATLKSLLASDPKSVMGHYYLGKIYGEMKLYEEAAAWMEKAIALKPGFASALSDLALLLRHRSSRVTRRASCATTTSARFTGRCGSTRRPRRGWKRPWP